MCVIISLLFLLQTQADNQKIFPTVVQQILQLQIHGQHPALAAVIRQLAVLDQAGGVYASQFIINLLHLGIRVLHPEGYRAILGKQIDSVPYGGRIHAFGVAVQQVQVTAILFHINQRQGGSGHLRRGICIARHQEIAHAGHAQKEGRCNGCDSYD